MGHSAAPQLEDLRRLFRVLGDARELRHDRAEQDRVLVDGLCDLVGGTLGWSVVFEGYRPGAETRVSWLQPGSVVCEHLMGVYQGWSRRNEVEGDPVVALSRPSRLPADLFCRSERISVKQWSEAAFYEQVVDRVGAVDSLALWFRYPGTDRIRGYALQRLGDDRAFSEREVSIARIFAEELRGLWSEGHLEQPGVCADLPPRLQRLLPHLLGGASQKQIAAQLGLSYHTVRSYVKELYDVLRVDSRAGLVALLTKGG